MHAQTIAVAEVGNGHGTICRAVVGNECDMKCSLLKIESNQGIVLCKESHYYGQLKLQLDIYAHTHTRTSFEWLRKLLTEQLVALLSSCWLSLK